MGSCCICNDFQPGQGTEYPVATWLANLLASSCPYCNLVVETIQALDPQFFADDYEWNSGSRSSLRLVETRDKVPRGPWIALSHCWGSKRFTCTTTKNIHNHKKMIDVLTLPPTFQDSIIVARELGVSYLWIDSLYIIQDKQDDWARQAEHMDKIYENALLVVAAVSSDHGSVPFQGAEAPSTRSHYHTVNIGLRATDASGDEESTSCPRARRYEPFFSPTWIDGPLEGQAWAWQERHFAVRILSFTDIEAKWRCKVTVACECRYGDDAYQQRDEHEATLKDWHTWIGEYSTRNLTYGTDKLPAISSVASRLHATLQSNYLAGLWEMELPFNLGWYREEFTDGPSLRALIRPTMDNEVPS